MSMHVDDAQTMALMMDLGALTQNLVPSGGGSENGIYAVFGAEGETFFIELAVGPMDGRTILKTIFVEFSETNGVEYRPDPRAEAFLSLPDASFLVGFLGLLQRALKTHPRILHPLTAMGDFLPGWNRALTSVSE
jgi:hypothetical protein